MKSTNRFVSFLTEPGFIVAGFVEEREGPEWLGGIAGLLAIVVWVGFLLIAAYNLATSVLLLFA